MYGEPDVTWSVLMSRWASVEPVSSDERFTGVNDTVFRQLRFTMHWDPHLDQLTEKNRIRWRGTDYDIDHIPRESVSNRKGDFVVVAEDRVT